MDSYTLIWPIDLHGGLIYYAALLPRTQDGLGLNQLLVFARKPLEIARNQRLQHVTLQLGDLQASVVIQHLFQVGEHNLAR